MDFFTQVSNLILQSTIILYPVVRPCSGQGGWYHFINSIFLFRVIAPPLEERYLSL